MLSVWASKKLRSQQWRPPFQLSPLAPATSARPSGAHPTDASPLRRQGYRPRRWRQSGPARRRRPGARAAFGTARAARHRAASVSAPAAAAMEEERPSPAGKRSVAYAGLTYLAVWSPGCGGGGELGAAATARSGTGWTVFDCRPPGRYLIYRPDQGELSRSI